MLWKKRNSNGCKAPNHIMPGLPRHLLCILFVLLVGCAREVSVDQKFVDLFVELRVIDMTYGKDSPMGRLVRQDALKAAGYTREKFLAKTDDILNDERQWVPFQKAVNARLESLLAPPPETAVNADTSAAKKPPVNVSPSRKVMPQMPAHKGGVR